MSVLHTIVAGNTSLLRRDWKPVGTRVLCNCGGVVVAADSLFEVVRKRKKNHELGKRSI